MPLITISGYPCSGKTEIGKKIAEGLREWLKINRDKEEIRSEFSGNEVEIVIIDDTIWGGDRREAFKDFVEEKKMRAQFISAVERWLSKKTIVIADGLNDIKGIRYQLYCDAKARETPHCVVYVETTKERSIEENSTREGATRYPDEVLHRLINRFEAPYYSNVWDSPLFFASAIRGVQINRIAEYLFCCKKPKPSTANSAMKLGINTNYAQNAEKLINEVIGCVVRDLESKHPTRTPYEIELSCSSIPVLFSKSIPKKAELYRCRSKFSSIIRSRNETDHSNICGSFVEFMNTYFD